MTDLDWPSILSTNSEEGIPTYPFVATGDGTSVIGYNHQQPEVFAAEVTRYYRVILGEDFDPEQNTVTADQITLTWATDDLNGWLEECDPKSPDAFPITLYGSL